MQWFFHVVCWHLEIEALEWIVQSCQAHSYFDENLVANGFRVEVEILQVLSTAFIILISRSTTSFKTGYVSATILFVAQDRIHHPSSRLHYRSSCVSKAH